MHRLLKRAALISCGILGVGALAYQGASMLHDTRFPNTDMTASEINAMGDPLANTRAAFLAGGPEKSVPFRVLFYGQSITVGAWPEMVVQGWAKRYPHLAIAYDNRAISGFSTDRLKRVIAGDLADLSPDLVVFHVYGSHHEYEEMIRKLAMMTGADIVLQTHHAVTWPEPRCETAVILLPNDRPGCAGYPFQKQKIWHEYMSLHFMPAMAEKYGFAIEPRMDRWAQALRDQGLDPSDVLEETVHLNAAGHRLMAEQLDSFVDELLTRETDPLGGRRIRLDVPPPDASGQVQITVPEAYRIEAVGTGALPAKGVARVNGMAAEDHPGCYRHGRASSLISSPPWPIILQIGQDAALVEETWTATLSDISEDGSAFKFTVSGSVTGADGSGTSLEDFTSPSGRVVLKASDWNLAASLKRFELAPSDPLSVTWATRYLCDDTVTLPGETPTHIRTLVTGLGTGPHEVTLTLSPDQHAGLDYILATPARLDE